MKIGMAAQIPSWRRPCASNCSIGSMRLISRWGKGRVLLGRAGFGRLQDAGVAVSPFQIETPAEQDGPTRGAT